LGSIGSAVLTFIGYKQTDKQTDRQAKFIYRRTKTNFEHFLFFIGGFTKINQKSKL
jgi:hypothetical protein